MRSADMPRINAKLHRNFPHCRVAQLVRALPDVRHLVGRGEFPRELDCQSRRGLSRCNSAVRQGPDRASQGPVPPPVSCRDTVSGCHCRTSGGPGQRHTGASATARSDSQLHNQLRAHTQHIASSSTGLRSSIMQWFAGYLSAWARSTACDSLHTCGTP